LWETVLLLVLGLGSDQLSVAITSRLFAEISLFQSTDARYSVQPYIIFITDETTAIHWHIGHVVNVRCLRVQIAMPIPESHCAMSTKIGFRFRNLHFSPPVSASR